MMGDCFSAVVAFLNSCVYYCHFSQIPHFHISMNIITLNNQVSAEETFCLRLISIPRIVISKLLQPQPQPLLPLTNTNTNTDSKSHLIIQNLQKLELGKLAFTLATTTTVGLLFSQKLEDDHASSSHYLIILGFMVSCMLLYNGVVFGPINPRLGNLLQLLGITLVLCLLCVLVGTFLPAGFSFACWLCAAFSLVPFLYILIKPHPGPFLQRFQA